MMLKNLKNTNANDPYVAFKNDSERRKALMIKEIRVVLIALISLVAAIVSTGALSTLGKSFALSAYVVEEIVSAFTSQTKTDSQSHADKQSEKDRGD